MGVKGHCSPLWPRQHRYVAPAGASGLLDLGEQYGNDQIELVGRKAVPAVDVKAFRSPPPDLVEHGVTVRVAVLCVAQNVGAIARALGPDQPTKIVALAPGSRGLKSTLGLGK